MIRIKSYFSESVEEIQYSGNLGELADACNPDWRTKKEWDYEFFVNGLPVKTEDLDNIEVSELCSVDIIYKPQGGIISGVGKLLGGIVNLAFGFLMPKSRSSNHNRVNTPQGESLEVSEIKANQARLGSVAPEIFGQYRVYMDYLSEPRRYFKDKRQQEIEALLCVGVGDYDIQPVKIGDTLMSDMDNTTSQLFKPNQDVDSYADLWHTVDEVGATSSGTAGLDLSMEIVFREDYDDELPDGGYIFNRNTITRADGTNFREDLQVGDKIVVTLPMTYTHTYETLQVTSYDSVNSTAVTGFFGHTLPNITPSNGVQYLFYNNNGDAKVAWYTRRWSQPQESYYYYGVLLSPRGGQTTSTYGANIEWTITDIDGDTITVASDNKFFPENYTSTSARIKYVVSSETIRSYPTNTFIATPEKVKTKLIEIDIFFPQGLCYVNDNGSLGFEIAEVEATITDSDNPSFGIVHRFIYRENTNDQIGFTEPIELPYEMRPSVQLRRVGRINNSVQSHSQVTWYGLKSRLPSKRTYPNWTTMGVRIQSGGKLSAQSENTINAVVTRKLPVLQNDGTWSEPQATRDIAPVIKYIAERIKYSDQELDMVELLRLHNNYWKPRNETFDYVFDEITVKQAIDTCLNAGMSDMTIANGQIRPVRGDVRTVIEQSYSAQNTVATISKTFRAKKTNDFDGVEVEYVDAEQGYQKKVIVCKLPQSQGIKLRKASIRGVTDKLRAWRIGMRLASEDRYVNKDYTIKTEMDALNSEYGSFIGVIEETPQLSQSCLILKAESDHVVVSEKPIENATIFAWRDSVGKIQGHFNIIRIDGKKIYVNLPVNPIVSLNKELPHAYIGTSSKAIRECLVDEITPNGTDNATIKASNYDVRVYAYDNSEIQ